MNAIITRKVWKLTVICVLLLLFFMSYSEITYTQSKILNKPKNLNSWTPKYLLPNNNPRNSLLTVQRTDFTIVLRDGVIIDCVKFVPVDTPPAGGWLTVIMVHGYGDNKETLAGFCRAQAEYGYYTMTYSVRGQGLSGGFSNLMSTLEADDLIEIVDWIKSDSLGGSNKDKILIMGGSQGGAVPLIAATRGLKVAAIINSVAPPDFATNWIYNGCTKMTLLWTIEYTPDTARYNSQVDRMSDWIYADNKQYWDSLAYYLPIERDFVNGLNNITIPVLIEAAWQDKFFNANGWLENIDKITNAPYTSYLGAVRGHGSEISLTEDIWHMNWFNDFFYQTLWNIQTPIFDQAKYQYASTHFPVINNQYFTFTHDSSTTLLRNISTPLKLYLSYGGNLKTTTGRRNNTVTLKNTVSRNYTLQDAVYSEFTGAEFDTKFKKDSLSFISSPITTSLEWTGTPVIKIDYKSTSRKFCQFNYQVYEILSTGEKRFISRANFTDRNYRRNLRKQVTFKGTAHSHIFSPGSRIQVVITNLDKAATDFEFFGTNPFVLPVMDNADHSVYLNNNSYIELPIVNNTNNYPSLAFDEKEDPNEGKLPYSYNVSQNFPNPFNPSTTINYNIAETRNVVLKVYDITGREVKTLVNNMQSPGSYSIVFNAQNLSSGIYFYKLTAGDYSEIKKMTLVK